MAAHMPLARGASIRFFNRFELKYLLTAELAKNVETDFGRRLFPDANGDSSGDYRLESLYYDSPDRRCYREKLDGLKHRRKLRLRRYIREGGFGDGSTVFVEIKQRVDRVTRKRRMVLPYGTAKELCEGENFDLLAGVDSLPRSPLREAAGRIGSNPEDRMLAEEIFVFRRDYGLEPACIVSYRRRAFVGSDLDPGLRVTFDSDLGTRTADLVLGSTYPSRAVLAPGSVIMEIKVNDRIPRWMTEVVAMRNLRLVRISKYVACLDAAAHIASSTRNIT